MQSRKSSWLLSLILNDQTVTKILVSTFYSEVIACGIYSSNNAYKLIVILGDLEKITI